MPATMPIREEASRIPQRASTGTLSLASGRDPMRSIGSRPVSDRDEHMSLLWAGLVIVGVAAVTITVMLLVRRRAPDGSYFEDGDRAAGVFGVIATGFAVLLGFVVFLAFESYDTSRSGAETEAQTVALQFQTAQLLPAAARKPLSEASSATRGTSSTRSGRR